MSKKLFVIMPRQDSEFENIAGQLKSMVERCFGVPKIVLGDQVWLKGEDGQYTQEG